MMIRVTKVEPRSGHRIWLLYSDGVSGVVDLSGLTGKGVFQAWDQPGAFDCVHVASHGAVAWNDEMELCPDALYMELTRKSPEQVLSGLERQSRYA